MSRVLAVANESPWPVHNGGRSRMAGLLTALAEEHDVVVAAADAGTREPGPLPVVVLPRARGSRARAVLHPHPRLGTGLLGGDAVDRLRALAAEQPPDLVLATHSYLVPLLPDLGAPLVLDLQNLEVDRSRSTARHGTGPRRALAAAEHVKARRWEPRAVRRAALCLAVTGSDAATARSWGAPEVLVVRNASDAVPLPPSPPDGHVLAVADWRYDGNRDALPDLLGRTWPRVVAARPQARLLLVGRGAPADLPEGVTAAGFVEDLEPCYAGAAAVVAPAVHGGGTQVKVAEAVARGRVVVCPPHGAASLPSTAAAACVVADDLSTALLGLLADVEDRHRRERLLVGASTTWADAARPLLARLAQGLSRG
jgi:glycosyltransferase involved in cell wall biosynthesis